MLLIVKLCLAHLVGDFFLQPNSWVQQKEQKKLKSIYLYVHAALHGALSLLVVWDWHFAPKAIGIALAHGAIDALKLVLQRDSNRRILFLLDQMLHFSVIGIIAFGGNLFVHVAYLTQRPTFWIITMATMALTLPASIVIRNFISKWEPETCTGEEESLVDAGKFIGILERLFVLVFIFSNHWEAIGFLIAAKSIFRFGDLKDAKDRKLTEYILLGTLMSFGIAVAVGLIAFYLQSAIQINSPPV